MLNEKMIEKISAIKTPDVNVGNQWVDVAAQTISDYMQKQREREGKHKERLVSLKQVKAVHDGE